ncbi:hypothetical protein AB1K70_19130 [Bremerella sp. JC770]|uniref:hypothetical protein n=1 Tax=Bremerella sp. JC770 TaxID=3232137 RepID=UPI00345A388A
MHTVLLELEETQRIDAQHSKFVSAGPVERTYRLDHLPRRGGRTRFVLRDGQAEAIYCVGCRYSRRGRSPVVMLDLVHSAGTPEQVEAMIVRAGFRPMAGYIGAERKRDEIKRMLEAASEYARSRQRVRVRVEQAA